MNEFKPKSWYLKVINIARSQLAMQEEDYRQALVDLTGKSSLKDMGIVNLNKVLSFMQRSGFKLQQKKGKYSPKTSDKKRCTELDKLRQVWIHMYKQGFLKDGSETALENWATAQVRHLNKGEPVKKLAWLKPDMVYFALERLKQWHKRVLNSALPALHKRAIELSQEDKISTELRREFLTVLALLQNKDSQTVYAEAFDVFTSIIKEAKQYEVNALS